MPSKVSDIHEISVLVGISGKCSISDLIEKKFSTFQKFLSDYGKGIITISKIDFLKKEDLFNRGIELGKKLKKDYNLEGGFLEWTGIKNHKEDSSDIYIDGKGISLKDSSKIIRNSGFEQLLDTFCKSPIKRFKDPFWEFSPTLSSSFLHTVIKDCSERNFIEIKDNYIHIDGDRKRKFDGNISEILSMDLNKIITVISKEDIKLLVKDFSSKGNLKELFEIRKLLVEEVAKKVISVLKEGLLQNPTHFSEKIKYMLQYRKKEKLFGFSSKKWIYAGKIKSDREVAISAKNTFIDNSKLTERTIGLQINIYTNIEIVFSNRKHNVKLQNQLRYKHRTFSCAPEANFHLLNYKDWRKLYPVN